MRNVIKQYLDFQTSYSIKQWNWLKIPFGIFWFLSATIVLFRTSVLINPKSICLWVDCNLFLPISVKILISCIALSALIFYILEKKMLLSTAVLSIISVLIFSMEDSQGIYNRNDILSAILIAQFIAYLVFKLKKSEELLYKQRIFFSQQIIIAIYFLSGLAKVITSGFTWFTNTKGFAVQIKKSNMDKYIISQNEVYLYKGEQISAHVLSYPIFFSTLLLVALLIELLVIVCLFNKRWIVYHGIALLLLHLGIWLLMSIVITPIIVVNLIFFVNFLFLSHKTFRFYVQKQV